MKMRSKFENFSSTATPSQKEIDKKYGGQNALNIITLCRNKEGELIQNPYGGGWFDSSLIEQEETQLPGTNVKIYCQIDSNDEAFGTKSQAPNPPFSQNDTPANDCPQI